MGKKRRLNKTNSKFGKKYSAHPMFKKLYGEDPVPVAESEQIDNAEEKITKEGIKAMSNKREALKAKALKEKRAAEAAQKQGSTITDTKENTKTEPVVAEKTVVTKKTTAKPKTKKTRRSANTAKTTKATD